MWVCISVVYVSVYAFVCDCEVIEENKLDGTELQNNLFDSMTFLRWNSSHSIFYRVIWISWINNLRVLMLSYHSITCSIIIARYHFIMIYCIQNEMKLGGVRTAFDATIAPRPAWVILIIATVLLTMKDWSLNLSPIHLENEPSLFSSRAEF